MLGYAGSFFARRLFAGTRRFGLYSALIMAEAVARIAIAVVVAVGLASGDLAIAAGIALAPSSASWSCRSRCEAASWGAIITPRGSRLRRR
ncbi:MAG: hypothetical protein WBF18_08220 [Solirubrobacterales bacterium]